MMKLRPSAQLLALDKNTLAVHSVAGTHLLEGVDARALLAVAKKARGRRKGNPLIKAALQVLDRLGALESPSDDRIAERPLPLLTPAGEARSRWSMAPAGQCIVIGSPRTAPPLHALLDQGSGRIALEVVGAPQGGAAGKRMRSFSKRLKNRLKGKSYAICAMERISLAQMRQLAAVASDSDVFLIFVCTDGPGRVIIGPMLAPGLEGSFEESCLGGVRRTDASWLTSLRQEFCPEHVAPALLERASDQLIQALKTPTLPLLWTKLVVSENTLSCIPLNNWELSGRVSASRHLDLERYLNPAVFGGPKIRRAIRSSLTKGALVSVRQALDPEFSELLHRALDRSDGWNLHEKIIPGLYFHHHNIYRFEANPVELLTARLIFCSAATQRFASKLSGRDCNAPGILTASWYMPGDHSFPHSDASDNRSVAFVWHLTKDWAPSWGGGLYWCPTMETLAPDFNVLHLFQASSGNAHFVKMVTPEARSKRLCVSGWWTGKRERPEKTRRFVSRRLDPRGLVTALKGVSR
jgi:hypothetical protein